MAQIDEMAAWALQLKQMHYQTCGTFFHMEYIP